MTEVSINLRNFFFHKIPPILKLEVGFFSDRKSFSQIFEKWQKIFHLKYISIKKIKKSEKLFWSLSHSVSQSVSHSLPPLRGGCQERGVVVRCERLRCTRLQHRTCKTRRGHFASHGLSAHGLSTERARLAGGTSLRSWFQKKCLLPAWILIFFPKKVASTWPDFLILLQFRPSEGRS